MSYDTNSIESTFNKAVKYRDSVILKELNDLIEKGILEVELSEMKFMHAPNTAQIELRQICKIVLKEREYIERLEKDVKRYKDRYNEIIGFIQSQ